MTDPTSVRTATRSRVQLSEPGIQRAERGPEGNHGPMSNGPSVSCLVEA